MSPPFSIAREEPLPWQSEDCPILDLDTAGAPLNGIPQMELAGFVYYTHHWFMIRRDNMIPMTSWLKDVARQAG